MWELLPSNKIESGVNHEMTDKIPEKVLVAVAEWFRRRTSGGAIQTPWDRLTHQAQRYWLGDAEEILQVAGMAWGGLSAFQLIDKEEWRTFRKKWEEWAEQDDPGVFRGVCHILREMEKLRFGDLWYEDKYWPKVEK